MHRSTPPRSRAGFTLIELLVVIAIIAIVASLTLAGVMKYLARADDLAEAHEITELSKALEMFKQDKGTYPPDLIRLRARYQDYFTASADDLDAESIAFISRIWPNMGNWDSSYPNGINWAAPNDPNNTGGFGTYVLRGHQCLVYFLGGPSGSHGFATNPKHPTHSPLVTANAPIGERKKYFTFAPARLKPLDTATGATHVFPYFASIHGTRKYAFAPNLNGYTSPESLTGAPFVYFTAGKNGYNTINKKPATTPPLVHWIAITYSQDGTTPVDSDVVSPLAKSNGQYWNPTSFQIISPGADGQFATMGQYDSGTSSAKTQTLGLVAWPDNRVNFSKSLLQAEVQ